MERTTQNATPNRLSKEKSPYLLQHAYNPVDWYPWGQEAFAKAKKEDKPVFLSIGYSTCHWCHVFARESFEDEEIAAFLNKHFVAVKVDREERPDIDTIYMQACQAMTGQGGWPLSIFMTPDKQPFYAGTYFPKTGQQGMPGFLDLLRSIVHAWTTRREDLETVGQEVTKAITEASRHKTGDKPGSETVKQGYQFFLSNFDEQYGGFGNAPKFPVPHNLLFLLRYWQLTGEASALPMVEKTLTAMYQGGIYDHIGFGFSRYSTDRKWLVPHFEKMLYDNALLAWVYGETFWATKNPFYARVVREIFAYVFRDMTSPEGAFYSAEDADSEGKEGLFYLWTPREVEELLGREQAREFCQTYDISLQGNFEGKNIPNLIKSRATTGLENARQTLFVAREKRVRPFKDDKILTGWNGLMIASLAVNGRILNEPTYLEAAARAMDFILTRLRRSDGRLLNSYRDGQAQNLAVADDYAYVILGLLELFFSTAKAEYLITALDLNYKMLDLFWDETGGGLFLYGEDAETLITRPKELYDGALPSGNSVAAYNFQRLARLTDDENLGQIASRQLKSFGGTVTEQPAFYGFFLLSILMDTAPPSQLFIISRGKQNFGRFPAVTLENYAPNRLTLFLTEQEAEELKQMIPSLSGLATAGELPAAYLCHNYSCHQPATTAEELRHLLKNT